jgi:hypothetical protein
MIFGEPECRSPRPPRGAPCSSVLIPSTGDLTERLGVHSGCVRRGSAVEGGEGEGVEDPAGAAVVAVLGEELTQLGVHNWAGLAEELLAEFEQLSGDLRGRSTKLGVRIGASAGMNSTCTRVPFRMVDHVILRSVVCSRIIRRRAVRAPAMSSSSSVTCFCRPAFS